jgi:hypothetical protein
MTNSFIVSFNNAEHNVGGYDSDSYSQDFVSDDQQKLIDYIIQDALRQELVYEFESRTYDEEELVGFFIDKTNVDHHYQAAVMLIDDVRSPIVV